MSGIYIHIPFCRKACSYCNFHFSTSLRTYDDVIHSIIKESRIRKNFFTNDTVINSVYLGGGTPSLLQINDLKKILDSVFQNYSVNPDAEITIEANPDDISKQTCLHWFQMGINRVSLGIQSFNNRDLQLINRNHNTLNAVSALDCILHSGFQSISADLIYGIPGQSIQDWENNIKQLFDFRPHHFSAYALTVEDKTLLAHKIRSGEWSLPDESELHQSFALLQNLSANYGYDHYEVSGFARDQYYAVHNSSYWSGKKYLGLGPAAHSYDGLTRRWNINNNYRYIRGVLENEPYYTIEQLSRDDQYNEFIMTRLRTRYGFDLKEMTDIFGSDTSSRFLNEAKDYIQKGMIIRKGDHFVIDHRHWFISDSIISDLFIT